jgi:putative membrane protein
MSAWFAFLHHLAAFALVSALAVEWLLMRGEPGPKEMRRLQVADLVFGVSAGLILAVGLLRVAYFEKGAPYYFHSVPFLAKLALFATIGLLSVYPTLQFLRWGKARRQGRPPPADARRVGRIRLAIDAELALLVLLILCAALMAKGIGRFG